MTTTDIQKMIRDELQAKIAYCRENSSIPASQFDAAFNNLPFGLIDRLTEEDLALVLDYGRKEQRAVIGDVVRARYPNIKIPEETSLNHN